jgi:hypothetical protein
VWDERSLFLRFASSFICGRTPKKRRAGMWDPSDLLAPPSGPVMALFRILRGAAEPMVVGTLLRTKLAKVGSLKRRRPPFAAARVTWAVLTSGDRVVLAMVIVRAGVGDDSISVA